MWMWTAPEEELAKAFKPNTRAVLAESIANPALVILDIEKMARLAHSHGVPPDRGQYLRYTCKLQAL